MAKEIGADRLGDFYTNGKVRNRREWRGLKDTMYDYSRWLGIMLTLGKFVAKPRNVKAMLRYRWMANYLAVPMMVDRHTQGSASGISAHGTYRAGLGGERRCQAAG